MREFEYQVPTSLESATMLLKKYGERAVLKAGGIDLVDLMKEGIAAPGYVIDLLALDGLDAITDDPNEGLTIGPLATLAAIAGSAKVLRRYPLLAAVAGEAATPQLRNVATLGGNLCQRPRCWYFRSADFACAKKGGDTCFAVAGDNRYHAIFGDGPCHIVSPSSTGLVLVALAGGIETASAEGGRVLAADQFFTLPETNVQRENALQPGEIISRVRVLPPAAGSCFGYVKIREKESFDWPIAEAAVALVKGPSGTVTAARIVLGAAAPVPWRAREAEAALIGKPLSERSIEAAARAAVHGATPMSGNAYKVELTREVVKRALLGAQPLRP